MMGSHRATRFLHLADFVRLTGTGPYERPERIVARDWESTFRRWKNPPSDTEDAKRDRTEREIQDALRASDQLTSATMSVYAKGSYKNNTNVRLDYDVDIAAEYGGFTFAD
jgi:hypothetical protein